MTEEKIEQPGRRNFLKNAALAGAASIGAVKSAEAAPQPGRKLRIGTIGVGQYSFTTYCWSDIIEPDKAPNNEKNGTFGTPFLNMDFTHVWDVNPEAAQKFADRMDATAVKKYDDMVGKIDGLLFGGLYEVPWQHKLARPYVEAGIPVYLSRPFAYRLRDIDEILDLAAKHNTPILATAKHEHYHEAPALKSKLPGIGTIQGVQAICNSRDFPVHFHTQFMLLQILGFDVDTVSVITDNDMKNKYLQETYLFKGDDKQPPYLCSLQGVSNKDSFSISIIGSENTVSATMVRSPFWQDSLLYRYAPQIIAMQRCFEGHMFEPLDNIRKKTEIFLTGYYSYLERGGAPVKVGSVPVDWQATPPQPNWIDESIFRG
ncbi:MAG: Gfo/Idh/MocA family oxidoreductase [Candidatus Latescibacteria bacterium]|nr:Gfo/Idh/MocA family oxidoreductase [Candidatus Latescibacterota bacterium]